MSMGWFITILGIVLVGIGSCLSIRNKNITKGGIIILGIVAGGIGTFFILYGQGIISSNYSSVKIPSEHTLSPQAEKLLTIIYEKQKEFGLNKLIISKEGKLFGADKSSAEKYNVNVIGELFNIKSNYISHQKEFENIFLTIPEDFLMRIPEVRLGSPYVVRVTDAGISYIKNK